MPWIDLEYLKTVIDFPHRPAWDYCLSPEEVEKREHRYFMRWIEAIYAKYSQEKLNCFEHNLEVWRQLWRVFEISDVILLLADVRHPLLHFPPALYHYISHVLKKPMILVLNKIDLVPQDTVKRWIDYFEQHYSNLTVIPFTSFPASYAQASLNTDVDISQKKRVKRKQKKRLGMGMVDLLKACGVIEVRGQAVPVDDVIARLTDLQAKQDRRDARERLQTQEDKMLDKIKVIDHDMNEQLLEFEKKSDSAFSSSIPTGRAGETACKSDDEEDDDEDEQEEEEEDDDDDEEEEEDEEEDEDEDEDAEDAHLREHDEDLLDSDEEDEPKHEAAKVARAGPSSRRESRRGGRRAGGGRGRGRGGRGGRGRGRGGGGASSREDPAAVSSIEQETPEQRSRFITIGLVGHPNAGKSSLINTLKAQKVVSVSRSPGHTKHFQTIHLNETLRLCDSPGLVFPAVGLPKELQVLCGLYPIAQTREPYTAVGFLARYIPIEHVYKLIPVDTDLPAVPSQEALRRIREEHRWSAYELCASYARMRGFTRATKGGYDAWRGGNFILRDVLDGRVLFYFEPPAELPVEHDPQVMILNLLPSTEEASDQEDVEEESEEEEEEVEEEY